MPEPTGPTVMDTPLGEVELDPTDGLVPDTQQAEGTETGPSAEGAQPEPTTTTVKVGDAEYTPEQLQEYIEDVQNARSYRRDGQTAYEETKQMKADLEALQGDTEFQELRQVKQLLTDHPELAQEWQQMRAWLNGEGPIPPGVAQGVTGPLLKQLQAMGSRLEVVEMEGNLKSARSAIDELLAEHNAIPGVEEWTRESEGFKAFFAEFDENHPKDGPNPTDIRGYFWTTHGPKLVQQVATQSKGAGREEVITKIQAGKEAARTSVSPAPHKEPKYEPNVLKPGFEDEINAAIDDDTLFSGFPR